MNELHPKHLLKARVAILDRFRILNTAPGVIVKSTAFLDEIVIFNNGYFQAALLQLAKDDCIEILTQGQFLRLLPTGYEEVHAM